MWCTISFDSCATELFQLFPFHKIKFKLFETESEIHRFFIPPPENESIDSRNQFRFGFNLPTRLIFASIELHSHLLYNQICLRSFESWIWIWNVFGRSPFSSKQREHPHRETKLVDSCNSLWFGFGSSRRTNFRLDWANFSLGVQIEPSSFDSDLDLEHLTPFPASFTAEISRPLDSETLSHWQW